MAMVAYDESKTLFRENKKSQIIKVLDVPKMIILIWIFLLFKRDIHHVTNGLTYVVIKSIYWLKIEFVYYIITNGARTIFTRNCIQYPMKINNEALCECIGNSF